MGNTPTPKPPLPFGGSTAEGPRDLFIDRGVEGIRRSDLTQAAITDVTNLVGLKVFDDLTVRGEIGFPSPADAKTAVTRVRQPWVLTCQKWIEEARYIIAAVNPKDVQWKLPQRSAVQKTRAGEILHIWKDKFRDTFYDEPQLAITFQSGNIMPIRQKPYVSSSKKQTLGRIDSNPTSGLQRDITSAVSSAGGDTLINDVTGAAETLNNRTGTRRGSTAPQFEGNTVTRPKRENDPAEREPEVPPGLGNFYEFLSLVDEQKILDGGDINFVYIIYNSRVFPSITLAGLFTPEGVSWTDSSDDPNQVNSWTANFTVYDSFPKLHDLNALTRFFQTAGFGRVSNG